jgi:hypothetical protein
VGLVTYVNHYPSTTNDPDPPTTRDPVDGLMPKHQQVAIRAQSLGHPQGAMT